MQNNLIAKSAHVSTRTGQPMISSLTVAELFEKRHDNILRVIQNAVSNSGYTRDFIDLNIEVNDYIDSIGRRLPMYLLTEKGFGVISSSLTGPKADAFRQRVWEEFERMQQKPKPSGYQHPSTFLDSLWAVLCPKTCWRLNFHTLYNLATWADLSPEAKDAFLRGLYVADDAMRTSPRTEGPEAWRWFRRRWLEKQKQDLLTSEQVVIRIENH